MQFRTHTGEIVEGDRLNEAVQVVADWYRDNAKAIFDEDAYASHVTTERKKELLNKGLDFAEQVRAGNITGFSVWQRVNMELTGECVALLP